ncbi:MAG: pyridoxal-phosphate dependent enzyme [Caldilineae bacterium]|nr:pyridoxal-phosphate dependent enzyme [Caldilineae bacterium]
MACQRALPADLGLVACPGCGSAWLDARYALERLPASWPARVATRPTDLWRYRELLPFDAAMPRVGLGEGWTPLIRAGRLSAELGHAGLWIKDERQQPTGSFKDRQAAVAVSLLAARGVRELVLGSTGNAAAAYAAYCARAGIKLWVFLASSVPAEKLRELALYGAEVVKVAGSYDQAKLIAADFAARRGLPIDLGAKAAVGKEGMKTIAFEIAEQLGALLAGEPVDSADAAQSERAGGLGLPRWQAPDWYLQAVSGGIGPLGVQKGFEELFAAGLIDRVPKLGVLQSAGCAPMVRAWERGASEAEPVEPDTLISVLATGDPGLAYTALKRAIDLRGGAMAAVTDDEAFLAMRHLARIEGLSVEPAVSVAFAGLEKLIDAGHIRAHERVVVNCSGHTFSAEKHALEDRHVLHLRAAGPAGEPASDTQVGRALSQLDEQATSIVVIDDNPHDSRLIRRLLQRQRQYRVFESHSGVEGIDLVRQRQPALVVLDLMMPGMDGFAVLEVLAADPRTREIPVVVISARGLEPYERDQLDPRTASIWRKGDFRADELLAHVVQLLGGEADPSGILAETTLSRAQGGEPEAFGRAARRRILVVDPNPLDARLVRRLFESRQRFEALTAVDGAQALVLVGAQRPDLLIFDPDLPDMSGEALLERLAAPPLAWRGPTLAISRAPLPAERRRRLAEGIDSVWAKDSLDRSSLYEHVQSLLAD